MMRVNTDEIEFTNDYGYRWNGRPFSGVGLEFNSNGTVCCENEFQNGMQHGTTRTVHPTVLVHSEEHCECNTLYGFLRIWNEDGVLEREEEYERGV
jgi:antitoxin component YwqK of YwqJK toxin-antitoxin module